MTRLLSRAALLTAAALTTSAALGAQQPAFDFSIRNIMRGPELYGRPPQNVRFSADGQWLYFAWLPAGSDWRETPKPYRVRAVPGSTPERVTDAHMDSVGALVADGPLSPDRKWRAVSARGDLYLVDRARGAARRLTSTLASETDPSWSADGRRVFFTQDGNGYELALDGGLVRQLTDIRPGPRPDTGKTAVGQRGALEAQQRQLLAAVRDQLRRDSIAKAERATRDSLHAATLWLEKGERVSQVAVSPSGRAAMILTTSDPAQPRTTKVPRYVTSTGYTEEIDSRTKVGDDEAGGRVGFVSLPSGTVKWIKPIPGDTTHPADETDLLGWNDAGDAALLFAVSRDFKTRYLHRVDGITGATLLLDSLRDSAWVDGPCFGCGGWYDGGKRVWFVSEADGFAHLWSVAGGGGDRRQLTSGRWEVLGATLTDDRSAFLLHTSEASPFEQHAYEMPVGGGARRRLTTVAGAHAVVVSPDGRWMADVWSAANRPPELYLLPHRDGGDAELARAAGSSPAQLTRSTTAAWRSYPWIAPEIVTIPASDGVMVPARIYRPSDAGRGAKPNGAAVIFVHGAGYLHNVHRWWSSYSREFMFNHFLASQGYVVLDLDYRGSAGYGRDWRTAIYRHMGGRDLQDQVDGSRYLEKQFGISAEHVGLYGGSYGGFITLMALFTEPKHFGAGAALRSVTDWAHYNDGYTGRILNRPQADSIAYRQSSPIWFAEGLEDPLLIAHGMVDTNVHFQDDVRLVQRLIELGKSGWELAVYPVEDHGFVRPDSWADEYRRIFELFQAHLPVR